MKTDQETALRIAARARQWADMSNSALRQRCGELTAQEIRTVRAVLAAILDREISP